MKKRNKACQLLQQQYKQFQLYKHHAIQDIFLLEIELSILNLELDKFTFLENKYKSARNKWHQHKVLLRKLACFGPSYCRSHVAKLRHNLEEDILLTMKEAEREGKEWRCHSQIRYGKPLMEIVEDVSKHRTIFNRWLSLSENIKFASSSNSIHNKQIKIKDKIKLDVAKMRKMCIMENKMKILLSASTAVEKFILTNDLLFNLYKKQCQTPSIDLALKDDFIQNKNMGSEIFDTINNEKIKFCKSQMFIKNKNTTKHYKINRLEFPENKRNGLIKVYKGSKELKKLQLQVVHQYKLQYKKLKPIFDGKNNTQSDVSYNMFSKGSDLKNKIQENRSEENSTVRISDNNNYNSVSKEIETIVEKYKTNGGGNGVDLMSDLEFTAFFENM